MIAARICAAFCRLMDPRHVVDLWEFYSRVDFLIQPKELFEIATPTASAAAMERMMRYNMT
jgi:hypothetical protein